MEKKRNLWIIPTDKPSRLHNKNGDLGNYPSTKLYIEDFKGNQHNSFHIYIISDEEIKEGEWYENNGVIFKADDVFDEGNNPNNSNPRVTDFNNKIILTTDQDLIKDGVQSISNEFLEWFVKNPSCEEVEVGYRYSFYAGQYLTHYKIMIPKEEPKQIKCYCGHTTMCDCSPIDEPKQEEIDFYAKELMLEKERAYKQQTLEKAAHKMLMDFGIMSVGESINVLNVKKLMVLFAKEQQERMLKFILDEDNHTEGELGNSCIDVQTLVYFIEQIKKEII